MSLLVHPFAKLNLLGKPASAKNGEGPKKVTSVSAVATPVFKAAVETPRSQSAPPTLTSSPPSPPSVAAATPALSVFDKAAAEDGAAYDPRSEAEKREALRLDAKPTVTVAAPPAQVRPVKETIVAWQNTPTYGLLQSIVPDQISPKKKLEEVHGTYIWFVTTAQMLKAPTHQPSTPAEIAIQKRLKHMSIPKGSEKWTLAQFRTHLESEKQA